jgi:ABC-type cobalamin/Fe3+-siderophores transport system ATPase subunit
METQKAELLYRNQVVASNFMSAMEAVQMGRYKASEVVVRVNEKEYRVNNYLEILALILRYFN